VAASAAIGAAPKHGDVEREDEEIWQALPRSASIDAVRRQNDGYAEDNIGEGISCAKCGIIAGRRPQQ